MEYIQEVLSVEYDEENTEELDIFGEGAKDVKFVEERISVGNPRFCQYFIVEEWISYCQLSSYYCQVEIDCTGEKMDIEEVKVGDADNCVELVDLTKV